MNKATANNTSLKGTWSSPALWAAGLFACINLLLAALNPRVTIAPAQFPSRASWEWLRTNAYLAAPKPPDVLLLGSSLMMIPMTLVDADCTRLTLDAVDHPQAIYLERLLTQALGTSGINCFNFGLPGAMISDDYLVTRALCQGARRPKVIVLGVAIRDFIDNGVSCAADTPTWHFFSHFDALNDLSEIAFNTPAAQWEYWQNKLLFLWSKRMELQGLAACFAEELVAERLSGMVPARRKVGWSEVATVTPGEVANANLLAAKEVHRGLFLIPPNYPLPFQDNSREYKHRYKTNNDRLFNSQKVFLDKLLALTDKEGIRTILVNMPLTEMNMKIMPAGSYEKYRSCLTEIATRHNTPLIDLNRSNIFALADFKDSAHMNGAGGKKLAFHIAQAIQSDDPSVKNLTRARQIAQSSLKQSQ